MDTAIEIYGRSLFHRHLGGLTTRGSIHEFNLNKMSKSKADTARLTLFTILKKILFQHRET
jgi:hypothetical protein